MPYVYVIYVCPGPRQPSNVVRTICPFQHIWNKVCLMGMVHSRDGELELIGKLGHGHYQA